MSIDLARLRTETDALRVALDTAQAAAREARRALDQLQATSGADDAALAAAGADMDATLQARDAAAAALHARLQSDLAAGGAPDELIAALEPDLPIVMLPLRIETAFAGNDAAPRLLVRIYPDELHVEQHEPELSESERKAGIAYWTAVRGGAAHDSAWAPLRDAHGANRAQWIREATTPVSAEGAPLLFPPLPERRGAWSRAPVASTLPDQFVVRVRAGRWSDVVTTAAVADDVPVGPDPLRPRRDAAAIPADGPVMIDPALRWMVDFDEAVQRGLGVVVTLPPGTRRIDDVTVVGCLGSLGPQASSTRVADLVRQHRYTRGASFVEPGTPTNNLSDSRAGAGPSGGDGQPAITNAAQLAAALGLGDAADVAALGALDGAARGDDDDARVAQQALFEATWGPYLRIMAQPGFPLADLPALRRHVIAHVRGGVSLPTLRLARQPYGVLPILPLRAWQPGAQDPALLGRLVDLLRRARPAWAAGTGRVPTGTAAYGHEPVSSRVRMRTPIGSFTRSVLDGIDFGVAGDADAQLALQERRLLSELGFQGARPIVASNFYAEDAPTLWLPMAAPDDLSFPVRRADPATAKSVLGLLLRDAARRLTTAVGGGLLGGVDVTAVTSVAATYSAKLPSASISMPSLSSTALSLNPALSSAARLNYSEMSSAVVPAPSGAVGASVTVDDKVAEIFERHVGLFERYNDADALAAFRDALAQWAQIPPQRWGRLAGEVLDTASHRYDAWVTSIARQRLDELRRQTPAGVLLGAWGHVHGIVRTSVESADGTPTALSDNGGHVLAPSARHAATAGVLRAAWLAHGGAAAGAEAPFATGLTSRRVREALALADGMRTGQPIGALLGYRLERDLHEAGPALGVELDWLIAPLRTRFPLQVDTQENALPATTSSRLVVDGWRLLQADAEQSQPLSVLQVFDAAVAGVGLPPAQVATARQLVRDIVADLDGALDALADLGLAEALYQMSGRNFERAAAATDMLGRAARPPDEFDHALSPRPGHGIEQRLLCAFTASARPSGWSAASPRARLADVADAFVASRLGPIDGLVLQPVDARDVTLAPLPLSALGWSALDLACDAAAAPTEAPAGPWMMDAVRRHTAAQLLAAGVDAASAAERAAGVRLRLDAIADAALLEVLRTAAAWHGVLAGREPITASALQTPQAASAPSAADAPAELASAIGTLEALDLTDAAACALWGLSPDGAAAVRKQRLEQARTELSAGRFAAAARALFGSDAVLVGTAPAAAWVQAALDGEVAHLDGTVAAVPMWLQDTARVREAATRLDEALLREEATAAPPRVQWTVAQSPSRPYAQPAEHSTRWVGLEHPAPLGPSPVTSLAIAVLGEATRAAGDLRGLLLDRWVETVPAREHDVAAAANLPAPDARPPNVILMAVPPVMGQAWSAAGLFATVDEALELAQLRMVDFEAASRVPALLPAIYVEESSLDEFRYRSFVSGWTAELPRWSVAAAAGGSP